jgi:hypothetical protein
MHSFTVRLWESHTRLWAHSNLATGRLTAYRVAALACVAAGDYGFREGPVFTYSFAQKDVNSLEMPPDAFGHGAESLGLPESKINFPEVFAGVGFDLLYHLLIVLVFSAVVSGIIIDSFAELRAKVCPPLSPTACFSCLGPACRPFAPCLWPIALCACAACDDRKRRCVTTS